MELLIALAIFATALLVIIGLFPMAARAVKQAQGITIATDLASRRMEELLAVPFDQLQSDLSSVTMAARSAGHPTAVDYSVQTVVIDLEPDLKQVDVIVSWTTDQARMVRLQTYQVKLR